MRPEVDLINLFSLANTFNSNERVIGCATTKKVLKPGSCASPGARFRHDLQRCSDSPPNRVTAQVTSPANAAKINFATDTAYYLHCRGPAKILNNYFKELVHYQIGILAHYSNPAYLCKLKQIRKHYAILL